jgi:hypothetical protein
MKRADPAEWPERNGAPGSRDRDLLSGLSDEFNGSIGAGWTRLRDRDVRVANGCLGWPVEATDPVDDEAGGGNDAGLFPAHRRPATTGPSRRS